MKALKIRIIELMADKQKATGRVITIADVAKGTGLSRQTVYDWAANRVSRFDERTILALCNYFECNVGDLMVLVEADGEATA